MEEPRASKENIKERHRQILQYLVNHPTEEEARKKYQESLKLLLETHQFERKK